MLKIFQVDAFTSSIFGGNPAAVVMLEHWLDDAVLQAIAAENNLAETAYLVPEGKRWALRWFTPTAEVAPCGHATLAAAHVLVNQLGCTQDILQFDTRESGTLTVTQNPDGSLAMSFPAIGVTESTVVNPIKTALVIEPVHVLMGHYSPEQYDFVAVFEDEATVASLTPDFSAFTDLGSRGVIATAQGQACDFVSRYFAPNFGIEEDPVTGSAHCLPAPYWANVLGQTSMEARQISARGGEIQCQLDGDRVVLTGRAVNYLVGTIEFE